MLGPPGTLRNIARSLLSTDRSLVRRRHDWVRPHQVDFNAHMNQASYVQVLELGRVDLLLGARIYQHWQAQGVNSVVANQYIEYRKELKPFQRYVVDTRHTGMDGRLFVFEQYVLVGDRVHARGESRLILVGKGGVLSAEDSAQLCEGFAAEPLVVENWRVQP